MKKHHLLIILLLAGVAAYLLNQSRDLKNREEITRGELNLLREAVKRSPGAASTSALAGTSRRPPAIDATKFTAELTDFLKSGPGSETRKGLDEFMKAYESQLNEADPKIRPGKG